jgi:trehalose 6-phosphate phosphatase
VTNVLAKSSGPTLTRFLASRVLLAFDFDGTLAPITSRPADVHMRRRTLRVLERVCRSYPCAVISGRRRDDVLRRLEGLPMRHVLGNHGAEAAEEERDCGMGEIFGLLERELREASGVEIEDKRYSVAIHYRRAEDRRMARAHVERALTRIPPAYRVISGKLVYDVVPTSAPHKGDTLNHLLAVERLETVIYIGDDATDEDAFRSAAPETLLSIRVGRHRASAASHFLRDQRDLDLLLELFVSARS